MQCEYFALEGLSDLMSTVRIVRRGLNPELKMEGVLLTMYDGRTNLNAAGCLGGQALFSGSGVCNSGSSKCKAFGQRRAMGSRCLLSIRLHAERKLIPRLRGSS